MKISHRLQKIDRFIVNHYQHIWDCCCDHGLLGINLLKRYAAKKIHFVDIVEKLIRDLDKQLKQDFSDNTSKDRWKTYCLDAAEIPIQTRESNLIIISGVGGDLLIDLVQSIRSAHKNQKLDFLLCPVYHNYKVRQALTKMGFGLINESLVKENKQFYEIIHISTQSKIPISLVGSLMWDFSRLSHKEYLKQTIAHYQRKLKSSTTNANKIVLDYKKLQLSAES